MREELLKVLDNFIERIKKGETIEACLAECPTIREQIEPLLRTALSIYSTPKVSLSDENKGILKARLMTRLSKESSQGDSGKSDEEIAVSDKQLETHERSQKETLIPALE